MGFVSAARVAAWIVVIAASVWVFFDFGFDSIVALAGALSALIVLLSKSGGRRSSHGHVQKQSVGAGGIGFQVGRDIRVTRTRSEGDE